jgi:hypothetical protein
MAITRQAPGSSELVRSGEADPVRLLLTAGKIPDGRAGAAAAA